MKLKCMIFGAENTYAAEVDVRSHIVRSVKLFC